MSRLHNPTVSDRQTHWNVKEKPHTLSGICVNVDIKQREDVMQFPTKLHIRELRLTSLIEPGVFSHLWHLHGVWANFYSQRLG